MTTNFQFVSKEEIVKSPEICELNPVSTRFGHHGTVAHKETWSVAFTPDYHYFAWSCGKGLVRLMPWMRDNNTYDFAAYSNFVEENNLRPCDAGALEKISKDIKVIEYVCNSNVWSMAFGSSVPQKKLTHHQFGYRHYQHLDGDDILLLAIGLQSGTIVLYNVFKKEKFSLIDHKTVVRNLAFAPDGSLTLVSACRDHTLKVWDLKDDGNMVATLKGHKQWVHDCAFSPDATHMASVGARGLVLLWNMSTYKVIQKLQGHYHDVSACQFSPDGAVLLTSSWDARTIAWDPFTGRRLSEFHHIYPPVDPVLAGGANDSFIRDLAFSPNGQYFVTICDDGFLRIWNLLDSDDPLAVACVEESLSCCFSPNGMVIAVGTRLGSVKFFLVPKDINTSVKLQHLCRMTIRKALPNTKLLLAELETGSLKKYLSYEHME